MTMKSTRPIPLAAMALLLAAPLALPTQAAEAKENWGTHCAACHGKDGRGQTKAGRMAGVKDQTAAAYQDSLKEDKMFASVKEGLKEGDKDKMKPFKEKLTDDEIKALVAYVRAFKK